VVAANQDGPASRAHRSAPATARRACPSPGRPGRNPGPRPITSHSFRRGGGRSERRQPGLPLFFCALTLARLAPAGGVRGCRWAVMAGFPGRSTACRALVRRLFFAPALPAAMPLRRPTGRCGAIRPPDQAVRLPGPGRPRIYLAATFGLASSCRAPRSAATMPEAKGTHKTASNRRPDTNGESNHPGLPDTSWADPPPGPLASKRALGCQGPWRVCDGGSHSGRGASLVPGRVQASP